MDAETLHRILQDAGIQADLKNLQNPTEEFMVNLITEYLNKYNLDGNEISKVIKMLFKNFNVKGMIKLKFTYFLVHTRATGFAFLP